MGRKLAWIGAAALTVGVLGVSAGVAGAETGVLRSVTGAVTGSDDAPIVGEALEKAVAAATAAVGEGEVTDTEADSDGDSAYEVEILKADGEQVEVNLDSAFKVIGSEVDDDSDEAERGDAED